MFPRCFSLHKCAILHKICVLVTTLLITGKYCIIPEASQEGILRPLKSYSDVSMFHYTVPKEVLRATWQFAAFTDDRNCPPREVHIHLQWGSYPVISVNNETFSNNMYVTRDHTVITSFTTTFEPKTMAIVPVYGPEPGDWFVGAYLVHWDKKIQQAGLGHNCHYNIGSVAVWTQADDIENILVGYQKTLRTKGRTSYYKVYIPSGTWNFRVYIWGCSFTVQKKLNTQGPCIENLILRGRVLPTLDDANGISVKNLSVSGSYTFTEFSPYEDDYHYFLIVSDSVVEFNIKILVSECPIYITQKSSFSKAPMKSDLKHLEKHYKQNLPYRNQIKSYNTSDFNDEWSYLQNEYEMNGSCIPRYKLARVKHSQTFSSAYLLQGKEWLTPWLLLTHFYPVIVQFDVLPLIDVGGTLDIRVQMEANKVSAKQLVKVMVCIRRGRAPRREETQILCDDDGISLSVSSHEKRDVNLLIPYPQPDTWYVGLNVRCFVKRDPVNCEVEDTLISLDIRTRKCVFSGDYPCGEHGVCQEIHRDLFCYTTCNCYEGYKGWGCTNSTDANSESSLLLTTVMLTMSNAFFLPAIYLAVKRGLYTEGLVYSATMLFSSFYHACDQHVIGYCIAEYEVLQYSDFFASILAFWVTLVAMARLPAWFTSICHMFGVLIIAFGVESNRTGLTSIIVPLTVGTMIPIGAYVYRCCQQKKLRIPQGVLKLLVGLLLAITGLLLFSLVETEANYRYVHSAWHIVIAISLIFLLPSAQGEQCNYSNNYF